MENTFLQLFLKTNLFDIDDNDERLKNLEDAIADLKAIFEDDDSLIPRYTLVALDPNINEDEPTLKEVEQILIQHWKTLRSKFKQMPRNILRGVILNSLYSTGITNFKNARIIYLTALNYFPFAKLGNEKNLVEKLIKDLGKLAEKDAVNKWSLIEEEPSLKIGSLKITDFKFDSATLNKEVLKADMKVAISNDPTGHSVGHGGNSAWGEHFAVKTSEGISKAINSSLVAFNKSLTPAILENPINKFFADFKKELDLSMKSTFSSLVAIERRSKLLWWKEALYSSSQDRSYRVIEKKLLPLILTYDYYLELPEITPISADYLLRDVIYVLTEKKNETVTFLDYLTSICIEEDKLILKELYTTVNESLGRISITDFITLLINDKISIKEFYNKTGVKESEKITYSDLSVIILHDHLTQYLITE